MDISVKIAYRNEKLQAARLAAGMSQSQLAAAAGISVRILQDYERGARDILTDPATLEGLDEYDKRRS